MGCHMFLSWRAASGLQMWKNWMIISCGRIIFVAMPCVLEQEGSIWTPNVEELDDLNCGRNTLQSRQLSRRSSHGGADSSWGGVKAGWRLHWNESANKKYNQALKNLLQSP
ncbi:uncharacterized protein LOC144213969 isoform X2 [Stigmatopora nigra]